MIARIWRFFVVLADWLVSEVATVAAKVWRFFVVVADWRTMLRGLTGQSVVDVIFTTNMRDEDDTTRYLGNYHPAEGHFNGPRYWLNGTNGWTRAIDVIAYDMGKPKGRRLAKKYCTEAIRWAQSKKPKVLLFAAGTKRIFDETEMADFKKKLSDNGILPTIGDNGTMWLLGEETLRALNVAGLKPGYCRIAIFGPYGFLGEMMTKKLKGLGYDIIGVGQDEGGLGSIREKYGITTFKAVVEMGQVDVVIACTHSESVRLTAEHVKGIRREGRRLLLLDVAEPSNMTEEEYDKCRSFVIRQDAGNAYAPKLKYVLGAISYKLFRLTRGVTFGCFAEALALASAIKRGEDVKNFDWLTVSDEGMTRVAKMFKREGFVVPSPRCFGKPVKSFNLNLGETTKDQATQSSEWKLAIQKMHIW